MNPLMMIDWQSVHELFCFFMWILVIVLCMIIVAHAIPHDPTVAHHIVHR